MALVIIAQTAAQPAAEFAARAIDTQPVAVSVRASVRVVRPAKISIRTDANERPRQLDGSRPQRTRDAAGTIWVEFN